MSDVLFPSSLLTPLFSSAAMRAVIDDRAKLQRMLDVEAALARAESSLGVIPANAAGPIVAACKAELYDLGEIAADATLAGNILIPMVKALTAKVRETDKDAAGYVHWGATSQDVIDTAMVLELQAGLMVLDADAARAIAGFSALAERHRDTPAVARTWLQHALPMPFGLKLAGYAAALARCRTRLARARDEELVLQFGGAAGTLAALGERGLEVAQTLAANLGLPLPDAPWHGHRDRLGEVAGTLATLAGTCGKIARDVTLLMQTDVGEAFEPAAPGRGGSSTMPQKRNPVAATATLSAAMLTPQLAATIFAAQIHDHERATGAWQAEWPAFPALLLATSGALNGIVDIAEGLEVDAARMRANLDMSGGAIMAEAVTFALAKTLGKQDAHHVVEAAVKTAVKDKRHLRDVLKDDAAVTRVVQAAHIDALFAPLSYQGVSQQLIDRMLKSARQ